MVDASPSLDEIIANPGSRSNDDINKLRDERFLGITAILLSQRGHVDAAALLTEVTSFELEYEGQDWNRDQFRALLDVDPQVTDRFTEEIQGRISATMTEVAEREHFDVTGLYVRAVLPAVSTNWRDQVTAAHNSPQTNQGRRVRLEPRHPIEDGLHFSNPWEHKVYVVLREQQASLPDNDTIGIVPLGAMKVRDHVFEPDFLVTYRGRAGVIEVDGPYHKGQISSDRSRERLLRHAGIKHIDRIDVSDTTKKEEVQKFVIDFVRQLES